MKNSNAMELHGFQTLLNRLVTQEKMNIDTISTDRHVQIRKLMRTQYRTRNQPCGRSMACHKGFNKEAKFES